MKLPRRQFLHLAARDYFDALKFGRVRTVRT